MDHGYQLPATGRGRGFTIGKKMIEIIFAKLQNSEVRIAYKLTAMHLYCEKQDRQSVKLATQLFSKSVAMAINLLEPNDQKFTALATFITLMDDWFDVMNSGSKYDRKELRCGFRVHYAKQTVVLESVIKMMTQMRQIGSKSLLPCQEGIIISSKAIQALYIVFHNNSNL
jgi:hypothetical protein